MPDLMSTDGDTPCECESCGRRRPLVGVRFPQTDDEFHVCRQCAVVGIRTHGVTEVELRFPVNPPDEDSDDEGHSCDYYNQNGCIADEGHVGDCVTRP